MFILENVVRCNQIEAEFISRTQLRTHIKMVQVGRPNTVDDDVVLHILNWDKGKLWKRKLKGLWVRKLNCYSLTPIIRHKSLCLPNKHNKLHMRVCHIEASHVAPRQLFPFWGNHARVDEVMGTAHLKLLNNTKTSCAMSILLPLPTLGPSHSLLMLSPT